MERRISITVSTPYLVEYVYRRISGELRARGVSSSIYTEGITIKISSVEGVERIVWDIVKTSPMAVFTSIDFK
ncbi:conserved hypothetical protein [Pyrobaculum islandicum DSM 4184]|uniref:Uncharacterized protein n=1 Tax=Pyrobaculum islandicum (strain DSM 4184 / JCM 9189 / GEO3) TaxID=384616 RepID=A1RVQ1_PYRIL|nr:hypothetical protein [Pyrobaculum islandicum]ABL89033.1 conserved hypothetical protein [Pyrobaculum islandicum DSM 4184]